MLHHHTVCRESCVKLRERPVMSQKVRNNELVELESLQTPAVAALQSIPYRENSELTVCAPSQGP